MYRNEIDGFIERGDRFYEDGKYERAVDLYIRALELDVQNREALEGLGQAYSALGLCEHAIDAFTRLAKVYPEEACAHYLLGHALCAFGDHNAALLELDRAQALGFQSSDMYSAIGYALHMQGNIESAIDSYRSALTLDPEDTVTMFNYGKALVAQRSYFAASHVFEQAAAIDPGDVQMWVALGEVCEDLGESAQAFQSYEKALDLDPKNSHVRCLAARVCFIMDRTSEAEEEYRDIVHESPGEADAWAGLGEVLIAQKNYDDAFGACQRALEIDPASPFGVSGFVIACEQIGALEDAQMAVYSALEVNPDCPDLWYLLAQVEASVGSTEIALVAYSQAIKLNSGDAAAYAGFGWALTITGRDYQLAEKALLKAVRLAPDWYYPCLQLAEMYLANNNEQAATQWFVRAIQTAPDEPDIVELLAEPRIQDLLTNIDYAK